MTLLFIYVFAALFFSFLCSIAEAVLLSITPSYIENLKSTEPQKAERIKRLRFNEIDRSLAAILTLNTIAHTVGAIVAGAKATYVFGDAWIGLFSAIITVLILFFSEIIPKTIGAVYWKSLTSPVAYLVAFLIKSLYPIIWLSEQVTKLISKNKSHHGFSRDEFIAMAGLGLRTGHINEHESRIIDNLFTLNAVYTKDIMTPRTVMLSYPSSMDVKTLFNKLIDSQFSRIPIFTKDLDDISSFVLKTDILMAQAKGENKPLVELQRELLTVTESTRLPLLLEMLLNQRQHIALVVDEYGQTLGLVTLEDVLETLLGLEIMDEVDQVQDMQIHALNKWHKKAIAKGLVDNKDS